MDIAFEHPFARPRAGAGPLRRLLLSGLVVATLGPLAIQGAASALAAAGDGSAGFRTGGVYLTTTGGATMFSLPTLVPGRSVTRYTTVAYEGSPGSSVRLFADVSGNGLERFLGITVTRGTGEGTAFVPDAGIRGAAGPGVVFSGSLSAFPRSWEDGVAAGGSWSPGEERSYRFEVTLLDRPAAQGLAADADFRWEARET